MLGQIHFISISFQRWMDLADIDTNGLGHVELRLKTEKDAKILKVIQDYNDKRQGFLEKACCSVLRMLPQKSGKR